MTVSSDLDEIGSDGVVDELIVFGYELVEAFLDDLSRGQHMHQWRNIHETRT